MRILKLTVIIPCYQEKDNVKRFAEEVFPCFGDVAQSVEYILVDDGSTDGTDKEIKFLANTHPEIKIITHPRNLGLGVSVRDGIQLATGDAILTLDADLTFHPNQIQNLLREYREGIDCVMGSPLKGKTDHVSWFRCFLSWGVNCVYQILLGQPVTSTSSLFRIYRSSSIKMLNLTSDSFQINAEILFKLIKSQKKVIEVPAKLTRRIYGKSKINFYREIKNHLKMFYQISRWKMKAEH